VRVDGEWGRAVSVGRERSCSGMSSGGYIICAHGCKQIVLKKAFYVYGDLPLRPYCRIRGFQPHLGLSPESS
jgi:hypothetical protein